MSEAFRDQGGAASSEPSWLRRRLTSLLMRRLADPRRRARARRRAEDRRVHAGEPHRVEYFHQPDDPYSQLAVQMLAPLARTYDIELTTHLVHGAQGPNTPEPEMLAAYARRDAAAIAPHYGLQFPCDASAAPPGIDASTDLEARLRAGSARRAALGHYSGAMFHYAGEWYWGVDRLHHLEQRLRALGAVREPHMPMVAPRPAIEAPVRRDCAMLTLEFFVSLRSPYTSIVYDRTLLLARECGVQLRLRPVLPMVMRGVPVTVTKGRYIFFDTAREAETLGLRWGNAVDPIGEPVRRVYSLLPWARGQGREEQLLGAALHAAFFDAVDLGKDKGLRRVVEHVGLDWNAARAQLGSIAWQAEFEQNRRAMYASGLWGVPSFRLLDANGGEQLAVWGQDRLWLVAREIARLCSTLPQAAPSPAPATRA